ncbi:hypothetical protein QBC43DRAFT_290230 [Cladorrhinum sp. PSN259]|nr:hypothetical protein QBC43DRAFT_290230 [Cladorrhinum sp. PSN259]
MRTSSALLLMLLATTTASATPLLSPPTYNPFSGSMMMTTSSKRTSCPAPISPNLITSPSEPPPYAVSISSSSSPIEMGFSVPSDAVGPCSVMIDLTNVQVTGSAKINLYDLDGPTPGALVGTTEFAAGSKATINSFACREQMCFRLEVADESEGSEVGWEEMGGVGGGLRMDYGC